MYGREQAQQMGAKELSGGVLAMSATGATLGPGFVDEVVGHERIQEFEQRCRASGRKIGIHGRQTTLESLTRQRQCLDPQFWAHHPMSEQVAKPFVTPSERLRLSFARPRRWDTQHY